MSDVVYYGEQTQLASDNFGGGRLPGELIRAYGMVKKACILAIQQTEQGFSEPVFKAIISAADSVINGQLDGQFPLSLMQGGAGTSINMNLNEVIASRARELAGSVEIDPIADINRYQSTNDTFPTAMTIVMSGRLADVEKLVVRLQEMLAAKEQEYASILCVGRTEMQDAVPITLGQVFGAWAGAVERDRWRLNKIKERLRTIPLGGTALGTCFSAPQAYIFAAERILREITGLPLSRSQNLPDEISNADKWNELASVFSILAQNIIKISGDLMIYTSSLCGELRHPALQKASTIMAAKTNPVALEYAKGLCLSVVNDARAVNDYACAGSLQLNPFLPFILDKLLCISTDLRSALTMLNDKFLPLVEPDCGRIEANLLRSNALLNVLLPVLGYAGVEKLHADMKKTGPENMADFRQLVEKAAGLGAEELDYYLDPFNATSPAKSRKPGGSL